jgi:uncharacterized membrane protein
MKTLLTAFLFSLTLSAKAEVFQCIFSEPLNSFNYNSATETLIEKTMLNRNITYKKVRFDIKAAGIFLLKNDKISVELKLNNEGLDGASENVFPYEAKLTKKDEVIFGACTSSLLPLVKKVD